MSWGVRVSSLCEFSLSVTLPAVWFPKQVSELIIKPHIHLKEIVLSPSNLLKMFHIVFSFTEFKRESSFKKKKTSRDQPGGVVLKFTCSALLARGLGVQIDRVGSP